MKISDILVESNQTGVYDEIIKSAFFKNTYLDAYKKYGNETLYELEQPYLYHASSRMEDKVQIIQMSERKEPRDTSFYVHHLVNKISQEQLGFPLRKLMFSYTKKYLIDTYGHQEFILFPLDDDYKLYINPNVSDFTVDTKSSRWGTTSLVNFIDYFAKHYPEYEEIDKVTQWMGAQTIDSFNSIANDKDAYYVMYDKLSEEGTMTNSVIDKHAMAFAKMYREYHEQVVRKYVNEIEEIKIPKISNVEHMIKSKRIAVLPATTIFDFIGYAKERLNEDS